MLTDLMQATQAARVATGMPIGTRAQNGRLQVVLVTSGARGRSIVDPLSDWGSIGDAIATLRAIAADGAFR